MPRTRLPVAAAKVTGAAAKNPQRHRGRKAAKGGELGKPSAWLKLHPGAIKAYAAFKRELPWLKESHRAIVEIASQLRGRQITPGEILGLPGMQELRRCLAVLGATPADESKVAQADGDEEDPEEALFSKPN